MSAPWMVHPGLAEFAAEVYAAQHPETSDDRAGAPPEPIAWSDVATSTPALSSDLVEARHG